jgi:ABC-type lipoprotein release transport system permease subunit
MMDWIERHRYFIDYTLSSLWRRKGKNISLLLVYGLVVFVVSSVMFFASALRREAESVLQDAPEMIVQRTLAGRHDLMPLEHIAKIEAIRGVQSVKGRLWGYYYHPAAGSNYTLMAPDDFPFQEDEIVVGDGVLRTWGTARGDEVYFKTYDGNTAVVRIAKAFKASTDLVSSDLILTSESAFRRVLGVPEGFVTDLVLSVRNQREASTIADKIVKALPETRPILKEEISRTYAALFDWRSGYMVVLLSGALLAFFIFAWDKATGLSAEEKTEIGILKAVGWDTSDVLMMKFWEGAVISLTAFLAGVTGAYIHVYLASAPLFEHALKGWATLYPAFKLTPAVHADQLAILFFLTVAPYALFTIGPVWKVSVTDPDAVMR